MTTPDFQPALEDLLIEKAKVLNRHWHILNKTEYPNWSATYDHLCYQVAGLAHLILKHPPHFVGLMTMCERIANEGSIPERYRKLLTANSS